MCRFSLHSRVAAAAAAALLVSGCGFADGSNEEPTKVSTSSSGDPRLIDVNGNVINVHAPTMNAGNIAGACGPRIPVRSVSYMPDPDPEGRVVVTVVCA